MAEVSTKVKDERLWATLAQLSGFVGFVMPFGNIVAPLLIWLIKKDESKFIEETAKESLNFQITITIAYVVCFVLAFLLIGFILIPVVALFEIVLMVQAAIKANNGETYKYPLTLRFIQ